MGDIGKLEDLSILVFIDEECGNDVLQYLIDAHSVTNVVGENIYSVTIWNIYCKSGKHDFSCDFFH